MLFIVALGENGRQGDGLHLLNRGLVRGLSNGFVEGKNNRTKALMRQGYGYPNRRHLRLRILLEVAS